MTQLVTKIQKQHKTTLYNWSAKLHW